MDRARGCADTLSHGYNPLNLDFLCVGDGGDAWHIVRMQWDELLNCHEHSFDKEHEAISELPTLKNPFTIPHTGHEGIPFSLWGEGRLKGHVPYRVSHQTQWK